MAATIAIAIITIPWAAFVLLWLERGTPPYAPARWAAVLGSIMLIIAPIGMAHRSSISWAMEQGLTSDQVDLLRALNYGGLVLLVAAIWMVFRQRLIALVALASTKRLAMLGGCAISQSRHVREQNATLDVSLLKWMAGFDIALSVAVLGILLRFIA